MRLRAVLVVLVVAAIGAFVVGVSIEHGDEAAHHAASAEAVPASEQREPREDGEAAHSEGQAAAVLDVREVASRRGRGRGGDGFPEPRTGWGVGRVG
jgi:hypothetical protein